MTLATKYIFIVALGGAIGSVARFKLGGAILQHTASWNFPLSTFVVNVAGCFLIGILAAFAEHHDLFSAPTRSFLFTGVLGGFTTFSAFGYESAFLIRRGLWTTSVLYALASVLCGIAAVFVGIKAVDLLWPPRH